MPIGTRKYFDKHVPKRLLLSVQKRNASDSVAQNANNNYQEEDNQVPNLKTRTNHVKNIFFIFYKTQKWDLKFLFWEHFTIVPPMLDIDDKKL